jgi:mRNA interferase RelE/StbE
VRLRIEAQIVALAYDPRPPGARNVIDLPQGYRIHVGSDYVIIYTIDDQARTVTVVRAGWRKDIYRGL